MERAWVWDGGRPCLDFVNTFRDRKGEGWELLEEPPDLAAWLVAAEMTATPPEVDAALLQEARELREAVNGCVTAAITGDDWPAGDVNLVNRWAAERRPPSPQLRQDDPALPPVLVTLEPSDPVRAALAELAADAVMLLGTPDRETVRVCASDDCGLRFADRSQAGRRQWCSMRRCGNRAKARAHRARAARDEGR
ncbi:CGNR zinc finger domain-containing protein [Sphaerisporangium fuscum]|uniref:CGNR zinc finger domain-containing protein n=1 Tax=Sphaerisporangium fuscum TaxID=2835868 RepID=UPI001BDC09E4|nr:CGNR zinc finger domain-containing protein [Sphaerisporangium fuscum]